MRLSILRCVVQGRADGTVVGEIQAALGILWSTLSHHPKRLTSAGLLRHRARGRYIHYRTDHRMLGALTDYLWQDCCKAGGEKACC